MGPKLAKERMWGGKLHHFFLSPFIGGHDPLRFSIAFSILISF